ncbi:MAG: Fe-S cluster assembly ATPase SufC [Desulfurococcus sp.]|nr:Fe-S cluster assembly ATPase SufC [Desulfurococcus sp.]
MLEARNLTVEVNGRIVVEDVSFTLSSGEIVVFMGPNGSGKTSLAYALMGHPAYKVVKGSIIIDGEDYTGRPAYERALAGLFLAFQNPVEAPGVTLEILLKSALNKRLGKTDLSESIPGLSSRLRSEAILLGLKEDILARDLNIGFSGGEKKRSEILQARILKPRYLILDEVDSGLDVDGIRLLADYINEVVGGGGGVLLITHSPSLLKLVSPRVVYVIHRGRVVLSGGIEVAEKISAEGYSWLR